MIKQILKAMLQGIGLIVAICAGFFSIVGLLSSDTRIYALIIGIIFIVTSLTIAIYHTNKEKDDNA